MSQGKAFTSHQIFWIWGGPGFLLLLTHFISSLPQLSSWIDYSLCNCYKMVTNTLACFMSTRSSKNHQSVLPYRWKGIRLSSGIFGLTA